MKKQISITNFLILFVILISFSFSFNKAKADTLGCCVTGGTNGTAINCILPSISPTGQKTCSSGVYKTDDCSAISACPQATNSTTTFANPLGSVTTISQLLSSILSHLMGIIAIIAIIFIVIGGIMYMLSTGNEAMVTKAKKTWAGAVIGLAIALAAPTFLKEIKSILNGNTTTGGSANNWVSGALTIHDIAVNVLNLLLSVVGIIAIIALVIGGGMYLTAYGDEKRIDAGKKTITYAILGIIVTLAALVIVRQIANLLGASTV